MSHPTARLDIPLTAEAEQRLRLATTRSGQSLREFVLENALTRAEETLADQARFGLDAEGWKAFLEALDAPPRDLFRLRRLFQEPSIFEGGNPE